MTEETRAGPVRDISASGLPAEIAENSIDQSSAAKEICLKLLTAQPRSRAQLAAALAERGFPEPVRSSVLDRLTEVGLVDDEACASNWVRSWQLSRGLSRQAISVELERRGITPEIVARVLAPLGEDAQEETARQLVASRLRATRGLSAEVRSRRLVRLLARRGFPAELAVKIVRETLRSESLGPGDDRVLAQLEDLGNQSVG
jgi:regulatory protein